MASKKTTVNLSEENVIKMKIAINDSGITQSDFINQCISEIPFVMLGNRKSIAQSFFELRIMVAEKNNIEFRKGVEELCQSLNLLMEKIEEKGH